MQSVATAALSALAPLPMPGIKPRRGYGMRRLGDVLLHRQADHAAPLGPRAVVVLDVVDPEQLVQHEPGVRAALADAAVGDDRRSLADDALAGVQVAQLVGGLERAVLLDRLRPGHRGRAGDMATALRALLLVARHRDLLAAELLRRAHVNQVHVLPERREHLIAARADALVAGLGDEALRLVVRDVGGRRAVLGDPLLARAVEQLHILVPVVLEVPVRVGREPVVAVAVEHDRVLVGDPARAEQLAEGLWPEEVAPDLVLQVLAPVEADRAGDVRVGVQRGVLVALNDADVLVVEALLEPLGVDQHVLGVISHVSRTYTPGGNVNGGGSTTLPCSMVMSSCALSTMARGSPEYARLPTKTLRLPWRPSACVLESGRPQTSKNWPSV